MTSSADPSAENFKFSALQYLNDWYGYDRRFVEGLRSEDEAVRLKSLQEAANYYRVARNFRVREDEKKDGKRLEHALKALDAEREPITEDTVAFAVSDLARKFQSDYGKYAISAASKFLWIRYQRPVVIYDSRACLFLSKECGKKLHESDYGDYVAEWRKQFAKGEKAIRSACAELFRVKDFSLAHAETDESLKSLVGNLWFAERVFDYSLWWNAGDFTEVLAQP